MGATTPAGTRPPADIPVDLPVVATDKTSEPGVLAPRRKSAPQRFHLSRTGTHPRAQAGSGKVLPRAYIRHTPTGLRAARGADVAEPLEGERLLESEPLLEVERSLEVLVESSATSERVEEMAKVEQSPAVPEHVGDAIATVETTTESSPTSPTAAPDVEDPSLGVPGASIDVTEERGSERPTHSAPVDIVDQPLAVAPPPSAEIDAPPAPIAEVEVVAVEETSRLVAEPTVTQLVATPTDVAPPAEMHRDDAERATSHVEAPQAAQAPQAAHTGTPAPQTPAAPVASIPAASMPATVPPVMDDVLERLRHQAQRSARAIIREVPPPSPTREVGALLRFIAAVLVLVLLLAVLAIVLRRAPTAPWQ